MATPTYEAIYTTTLASSASEVLMTQIPQAYRDLVLVAEVSNTSSGTFNTRLTFNGDSSSSYSHVWMYGNGSSASSGSSTNSFARLDLIAANDSSDTGMIVCEVLDFLATDKHKPFLVRANNAARGTDGIAGRWANTSAISSISIFPNSNSFAAGSTFSLFGISGVAV